MVWTAAAAPAGFQAGARATAGWFFFGMRAELSEHEKRSARHRDLFFARRAYRLLLHFVRDRPAVDSLVAQVYFELGWPRQRTLNERFRERILDVLLKRAPQRPGAIAAIYQRFLENVLGCVLVH